jgi:hypothetical protein
MREVAMVYSFDDGTCFDLSRVQTTALSLA